MSKNENQIKLIAELAVKLECACSLIEDMEKIARNKSLLTAADFYNEKSVEWQLIIDKARALIFEMQVNDSQPEYKIQKIGGIDQGIDVTDEYLLITRLDDDIALNDLESYLHKLYYRDGSGPVAYSCHIVGVVITNNKNQAIATVHYRYDV